MYVPPDHFGEVELVDGNDNHFGSLFLCTNPAPDNDPPWDFPQAATGAVSLPVSAQAVKLPEFPEVFGQTALKIGRLLGQMNGALMNLHTTAATAGSVDGINRADDDMQAYIAAASGLVELLGWQILGRKGKKLNFWPLVGFNPQVPLTLNKKVVSTEDVANDDFPDPGYSVIQGKNKRNALYLYSTVPSDLNQNAVGALTFYQDAEWPDYATEPTAWSSYGFVVSFEFQLHEAVGTGTTYSTRTLATPLMLAGISSSSSSSSHYVASSSYP